MHNKGIIHRDIKPDNFLMGNKVNQNIVYIIDMGLSKRFIDPNTGEHIPFKDGKSLTGTVRYSSIFTHQGMEQSRRDDLEGLSYVLIYFLRAMLPWQGQRAKTKKEKYQKIMNKKIGTTLEDLCNEMPSNDYIYLNNIIDEFADLLLYVRKLKFTEKPDYNMLKERFMKLIENEKMDFDYKYDWMLSEASTKDESIEISTNNNIHDNQNNEEEFMKEEVKLP